MCKKKTSPSLLILCILSIHNQSHAYQNKNYKYVDSALSLKKRINNNLRGGHAIQLDLNSEYESSSTSSSEYSTDSELDIDSDVMGLDEDYDALSDEELQMGQNRTRMSSRLSSKWLFSKLLKRKNRFGIITKKRHLLLVVLLIPVVLYILRIPILLTTLHILDHPESIAKLLFLIQVLSRFFAPTMSLNRAYVPPRTQHFMFECVNERYKIDGMALQKTIKESNLNYESKSTISKAKVMLGMSNRDDKAKEIDSEANELPSVSVVLNLKPDQAFTEIDLLRDQIAFLLDVHRENRRNQTHQSPSIMNEEMEVILNIESGGGMVQPYALAAAHVARLRNETGMKLTVCVDQVAASGGYMVACQASPGNLLASPFAIVGSIGVVGQVVNIHGVLQKSGVKTVTFKSNEAKAPIGLLGEITEEGIEHIKVQFSEVYEAFKNLVASSRPQVNIGMVSTGKVWLGQNAIELGLVDRIITSDEYILERIADGAKVLKLVQHRRQGIFLGLSPSRVSVSLLKVSQVAQQIIRAVKEEISIAFQPLIQHNPI